MIKNGLKLPTQIDLLGYRYKIIYSKEKCEADGADGLTVFADRVIYVNPDMHISDIESTLFHEVMHALLHITGLKYLIDSKREEAIVRGLEHGLIKHISLKRFQRGNNV